MRSRQSPPNRGRQGIFRQALPTRGRQAVQMIIGPHQVLIRSLSGRYKGPYKGPYKVLIRSLQGPYKVLIRT